MFQLHQPSTPVYKRMHTGLHRHAPYPLVRTPEAVFSIGKRETEIFPLRRRRGKVRLLRCASELLPNRALDCIFFFDLEIRGTGQGHRTPNHASKRRTKSNGFKEHDSMRGKGRLPNPPEEKKNTCGVYFLFCFF